MPVCDVVVVGSYPPVPGPATEATLSAVRRAWESGSTVGMASYRTGAAAVRVPVAGPLAGWRLEQVRRHFGQPAHLVLTIQRGVPFSDDRWWPQLATAAGLALAIRRFRQATVIVAEDPGIARACLRAVVYSSGQCTVATDADARSLAARYGLRPGAGAVTDVEPYPPPAPRGGARGRRPLPSRRRRRAHGGRTSRLHPGSARPCPHQPHQGAAGATFVGSLIAPCPGAAPGVPHARVGNRQTNDAARRRQSTAGEEPRKVVPWGRC